MKKKLCLITGSLFALIIFLTLLWQSQLRQTISAAVISEEQMERLEEDLEMTEELEYQLLFHGEIIPYDKKTNTYYLPQTSDGDWLCEDLFAVSEEKLDLRWSEDCYWEKLDEAIAEGHAFTFIVYDEEKASKGQIVFTGIPMMRLEKQQTLEENHYYCKVTVFDPFHNSNDLYEITGCYGHLELRGRTSKAFPKKGWDLSLVKENNQPYKTSLFGLREDDDWKLNALYPDATKVREAVCMELWNELAAQTESPCDAGSHMEYFELVTDEEYTGLYGAMEQLDYKQFSLDKNEDMIYKAYAWPLETHPERYSPEQEAYGHLIKTGGREITADMWTMLAEYVVAANFDEHTEKCDTNALYEYMKEHMNLDNFLNIELYIQTLYAFDNKYKNLYIAADVRENGEYTLWKIPWDLNYSFGDRFHVDANALTTYNLEWAKEIMPQFMLSETLLEAGNQEFSQILNEKWDELKTSVFSVENVQRIAQENMDILVESGAFARDEKCWPEGPHSTSLEQILEFHSCRLEFLDEHYGAYLNEK